MGGRARWLAASVMWLLAGFVFPFLTPATTLLSEGLERYLTAAAGMPDELADRVAFTIVRIPVTALLGILVAAVQCAVLRGVRPLARRWIIAAAVGACISTLIWLPSTLVALEITGTAFETIRVFLLPPGAALFGGPDADLCQHGPFCPRFRYLDAFLISARTSHLLDSPPHDHETVFESRQI